MKQNFFKLCFNLMHTTRFYSEFQIMAYIYIIKILVFTSQHFITNIPLPRSNSYNSSSCSNTRFFPECDQVQVPFLPRFSSWCSFLNKGDGGIQAKHYLGRRTTGHNIKADFMFIFGNLVWFINIYPQQDRLYKFQIFLRRFSFKQNI